MTELIGQRNIIEARARSFERAIMNWMMRLANRLIRPTLESLEKSAVAKASRDERKELHDLLYRFGLRQLADGASRIAGKDIRPRAILDATSARDLEIPSMVGWFNGTLTRGDEIINTTEEGVKDFIKSTIKEAHSEDPRPSNGVIARKIREGIAGPLENRTGVMSFSRAAVIARTELLMAENTGLYAGMEAIGADFIEWLAFQSPIFERRHDKMKGVRVKLGEKFELPSGIAIRYPGDPSAPIGETINCRCTIRAVKVKK